MEINSCSFPRNCTNPSFVFSFSFTNWRISTSSLYFSCLNSDCSWCKFLISDLYCISEADNVASFVSFSLNDDMTLPCSTSNFDFLSFRKGSSLAILACCGSAKFSWTRLNWVLRESKWDFCWTDSLSYRSFLRLRWLILVPCWCSFFDNVCNFCLRSSILFFVMDSPFSDSDSLSSWFFLFISIFFRSDFFFWCVF